MTTRRKSDARRFLEQLTGGPLTLGRALRSIRLGEERSLVDFSRTLKISATHLSDIELGRKTVSAERAARFARLLRHSEEQFVRLALQDLVSHAGLKYRVNLEAA